MTFIERDIKYKLKTAQNQKHLVFYYNERILRLVLLIKTAVSWTTKVCEYFFIFNDKKLSFVKPIANFGFLRVF